LETIAVYEEEGVKVYGITEKADLALAILRFPTHQIERWGVLIAEFENHIKQFDLITYHATNKDLTELHLLFDREEAERLNKIIKKKVQADPQTEFRLIQPVDILYLHGPHFQDRFGIADVAFNALLQNKINILVAGCAGTSMHLVTPANQGRNSLKILTETFLIPTSV